MSLQVKNDMVRTIDPEVAAKIEGTDTEKEGIHLTIKVLHPLLLPVRPLAVLAHPLLNLSPHLQRVLRMKMIKKRKEKTSD